MTKTQLAKVKLLRAKAEAGATIRESEWLAWQKLPKLRYDDDRDEATMRHAYLAAMGLSDESDANPAAIYWHAYEALERGESCAICGRRGENPCRSCHDWTQTMSDRKAIRARVSQSMAA